METLPTDYRMNPIIQGVTEKDDYEALPVPVKAGYSRKQFLWLSDQEKATLVQRETEPEFCE